LEGRSSTLPQNELVELKKRYLGQHLCARYFWATVGTVMEEVILRINLMEKKMKSFGLMI